MLGEFFAAVSIDDTVVEDGPFDRYEAVTAKSVSAVSIATLGDILSIGTNDEVYELVDQGRVAEHGEAGIDVVPETLRDALALEDDLAGVAKRWHATDEMREWRPRTLCRSSLISPRWPGAPAHDTRSSGSGGRCSRTS